MSPDKFEKLVEVVLPIATEIARPKKHVSLILRKKKIVSIGTNTIRTHPQAKKLGYRFGEVHSELDALLRYRGSKDGLSIINFRYNRFGDMRMSKPCCKCLPWCVALFDDIWYTTNSGIVQLERNAHV
tara:strand:- start:394 stop:777 length:384 start_codon:yes stop_codon:yes gene_type:complete